MADAQVPQAYGVLVVPPLGDPAGLLAPGVCGALPPVVAYGVRWPRPDLDGRCPEVWLVPNGRVLAVRALPLRWEGALVPGGWSRAREAAMTRPRATGLWLQLWEWGPERVPSETHTRRLAAELVSVGFGERVVLVDADGRELEPSGPSGAP